MSLLDRKYKVVFRVVNKDDVIATGVAQSLFFTDQEYKVGQCFNHHYHKVECEVIKVEENKK